MARKTYKSAIEFVALNDDPEEHDIHVVAGTISVGILAHIYSKTAVQVATDIVKIRVQPDF